MMTGKHPDADHLPAVSTPVEGAAQREKKREPEFDAGLVRAISEAVYRERLGEGGAARMIAEDADDGEALRERSASYDSLTRSYLRAIKAPESGHDQR